MSSLVYAFATVRKTIREGGTKNSRWPWAKKKQLENSHLLLDNEKDNKDEPGCLKNALTGEKLEQILTDKNMERLTNDKELANKLNVNAIKAMKELGKDGVIWEFDDKIGDKRQLVYAITLNEYVPGQQRIWLHVVKTHAICTNVSRSYQLQGCKTNYSRLPRQCVRQRLASEPYLGTKEAKIACRAWREEGPWF